MAAIEADTRDESLAVLLLLSWRFLLAGLLWVILFPAARKGWTAASLGRAALLGLPFTFAMILQHMGLTHTTEAVNAFLTSLNVLFVPLLIAAITFRLPNRGLWLSIGIAVAGIWLLSAAGQAGVGIGEALGVACSILFSVHIILINTLLSKDSPARMVGGQFLFTGITMLAVTLIANRASRQPAVLFLPFTSQLLPDFGLLVIVSTVLAFGLMIFFQPKVDPTRAALIYLTEPVFAAAYAWIFAGKALSAGQVAGATLIIVANSLVEWISRHRPIEQLAILAPQPMADAPTGPHEPLVLAGQVAKMSPPAQDQRTDPI
jgi:drug/metabolite transporter (DMT)-like permease